MGIAMLTGGKCRQKCLFGCTWLIQSRVLNRGGGGGLGDTQCLFWKEIRYLVSVDSDSETTVFFGNEGDFSSPGYPNFYPDYLENQYQIRGTDGNTIKITFHEISLQTDGIDSPHNYLSVRLFRYLYLLNLIT